MASGGRSLPDPSFDPSDVLARVEGDRGLLAELVDIFGSEYPRLLANLRRNLILMTEEASRLCT